MDQAEIIRLRLHNHQLSRSSVARPADAVRWQGAMQSQEYGPALWSVGLRLTGAAESDIIHALAAGELLRTHVLRPTWHFVAAADICWLQE